MAYDDNAAYRSDNNIQEQAWFISTSRQAGKSWALLQAAHERLLREAQNRVPAVKVYDYGFPIYPIGGGFDPATPGSDQTVVFPVYQVAPSGERISATVQGDWKNGWHPVKDVPPCPIAEVAFPKQPDTEHIWNMIVLAAESSRYG